MPHGDLDPRFANCGCTPCTLTRNFAAFRDSADPPARPAVITARREAAHFLRWLASELVSLVDMAKSEEADEAEDVVDEERAECR